MIDNAISNYYIDRATGITYKISNDFTILMDGHDDGWWVKSSDYIDINKFIKDFKTGKIKIKIVINSGEQVH